MKHGIGNHCNKSISPNVKFCETSWRSKCFLQDTNCCCYQHVYSGLFPPVLRTDLQPGKHLGLLDYIVHTFPSYTCSHIFSFCWQNRFGGKSLFSSFLCPLQLVPDKSTELLLLSSMLSQKELISCGSSLLTWCFVTHLSNSYIFWDSQFAILIFNYFLDVMATLLKLGGTGF